MGQPPIYGIDIETDTTRNGLDPALASVVTVALSGRSFEETYVGHEATILRAVERRLGALAPGILATWNGATFDLPFIADRARLLGLDLTLRLCPDRRLDLGRAPLPGHPGAYRGTWGHHGHIDTFRLYGATSHPSPRTPLGAVGRLLGLGGSPARPRRTHDLSHEALHAHAASDAHLARVLAERRRRAVLRLADRVGAEEAQAVAVAAQRLARQARRDARPLRPTTARV